MVSQKTLNTLLASAVALTIAGAAVPASAEEAKEKCYGVVKAGQNDCANGSKSHSCAGLNKEDGNKDEWVALPAGTCTKLVNGSLEPASAAVPAAPEAAAPAPEATAPAAAMDAEGVADEAEHKDDAAAH